MLLLVIRSIKVSVCYLCNKIIQAKLTDWLDINISVCDYGIFDKVKPLSDFYEGLFYVQVNILMELKIASVLQCVHQNVPAVFIILIHLQRLVMQTVV